jgi:hypothetical protein
MRVGISFSLIDLTGGVAVSEADRPVEKVLERNL